ncbi:MAG TPA: TM1802 family CRISPR-associated protein [Candidatus Gastranaerophilales bacterium]|nr:TM1802 family CRISPR-associated protein [Candidatus Gastranaerophilales bacterium]
MFTLIKELAELDGQDSGLDIRDSLENPKSKSCYMAYFLELNEKDLKIEYTGIYSKELDSSDVELLLYPNKTVAKGINKTPTVKFNDYEKSYKQKIYNWFDKKQNDNALFKAIKDALNDKEIEEQIKQDIAKIPSKTYFLSIKINQEFIGKRPEFINLIVDEQEKIKEYSTSIQDNIKDSRLDNSCCSICQGENKEVYGFASPFSFYTVKGGRFSYELNPGNSVKQLPICLDCANKINNKGKKYLKENLSFKLFNINYFFIPELVNDNPARFKEIVEKISKKYEEIKNLPKQTDGSTVRRLEQGILKELSNENNYLNYNFFFYEQKQAKTDILASIEEVAPTNLRKFFETARELSEEFKHVDMSHSSNVYDNPLFVIKLFMVDKDNKGLDKNKEEFCAVLNKIFNLKPLNFSYILNKFMKRIDEQIPKYLQPKENDYFKKNILDSFYLINVFTKLGLFKENINLKQGDKKNMGKLETPLLDEFCGLFPHYFNPNDEKCEAKKAVLGYGILVERIAILQTLYYENWDSKPIYKKYRNFKVDIKFLQSFRLAELKDYPQKYKRKVKKFSYKNLDELINEVARVMANVKENDLSPSETSYLFSLGITLSRDFHKKAFKEQEEQLVEV